MDDAIDTADLDCPICQGAGTILLPLYRKLTAAGPYGSEIPDMPIITEDSRRFSCPECGGKPPQPDPGEKFSVVRISHTFRGDIENPSYIEDIQTRIAARLARVMMKKGLIIYTERPNSELLAMRDFGRDNKIMEGAVAAVWPKGKQFARVLTEADPVRVREFDKEGVEVVVGTDIPAPAPIRTPPVPKMARPKSKSFDRQLIFEEDEFADE